MSDTSPYLQRIVNRFADSAVQMALQGFTRTLQFRFTDTREDWLIRAVDGKEAILTQETVEKPDIVVTVASDVLAGIMDKRINPATAYMQRKIQVKGPMQDLMRLQKLLL